MKNLSNEFVVSCVLIIDWWRRWWRVCSTFSCISTCSVWYGEKNLKMDDAWRYSAWHRMHVWRIWCTWEIWCWSYKNLILYSEAWHPQCLTLLKAFGNCSCSRSEDDTKWIGGLWCSICRGVSLKYEAWKLIKIGVQWELWIKMADFPLEWQFVFCPSGHDTYAYKMSLMYVHVGGGALIFNIPGGRYKVPW